MQGSLVAVAQRLVADRHLQPREALRHPVLRGGGELLAVEEAEPEGRVDRHAVARAAEQPPHRLAQRLALDVPQREIDRRDRMRRVAGLPARHRLPVQLLPDRLMRHRVVADDRRSADAVDDLRDHVLLGDRREAVADEALVGLDLDMAAGERGLAVHARQRDVQRHVERSGGDTRDLLNCHGWSGVCLGGGASLCDQRSLSRGDLRLSSMIAIERLSKTFETSRGTSHLALSEVSLDVAGGRVRLHPRAVRLRQVDACSTSSAVSLPRARARCA